MYRQKLIEKILPHIKFREILKAQRDLWAAVENCEMGSEIPVTMCSAALFCVGVACGRHYERTRRKSAAKREVSA